MTVKTDVKLENLIEFYRFHLPGLYMMGLYVMPIGSIFFVIAFLLMPLWSPEPLPTNIPAMTGSLFLTLLLPFVFRYFLIKTIKVAYKQDQRFHENLTYEFSTQGLTMRNSHSTTKTSWSEIVRFGESKNGLYLYLTPSKAFILPKRDLDPRTLEFLRLRHA